MGRIRSRRKKGNISPLMNVTRPQWTLNFSCGKAGTRPPRAGSRRRTGTCSATRYASPSFPGRSRRRTPTVSDISWLCDGRREGTSSSSPPTRTRPISITTFITIPPPLTAPINTGTSSAPAVPWGGCPTPYVWKTASLS